jgi:ornithine cyclodeaminase
MEVKILTEAELRDLVSVDDAAISAVEKAFAWLTEDKVAMPPIMHIEVPEFSGDVDIKAAYVKGLDRFAVKIGAGFFENEKRGLPSSPAMMVVLDARTGFVEAVLFDNAYLTDVRTGAAGAVAAKHLAPSKVHTAGVIGAGVQGRFQATALALVRPYERLLVYDTDSARLDRFVEEMGGALSAAVAAASGPEEVIRESQAVVTCTPSRKPYIQAAWLHPRLHITAMGADLPEKQELYPEAVGRADVLACDRISQSLTMGEFHHAAEAGILSDASLVELGQIVTDKHHGRTDDDQITLCDLSGTGVQDTAIAHLALELAADRGIGSPFGY